jgi:hypothetical protein
MNVMRAILAALIFCLYAALTLAPLHDASGRDLDGRYAKQNPALHAWFDQLASKKGLCCSFADGVSIQDVDWDTQCERLGGRREQTENCRYRVRLLGEWIVVPDAAVVTEPNRFGPAVVWPYLDADGQTQIRCFLPGAGA